MFLRIVFVLACALLSIPFPAVAQDSARGIFQEKQRAVVRVETQYYRRDSGQPVETGKGTAFFIRRDGLLVTAAHVVTDKPDLRREVRVYPTEGNDSYALRATVIRSNRETDAAVLQVGEDRDWPTLSFGNSDGVRQGDSLLYIGFPVIGGGSEDRRTFREFNVTNLRDGGYWRSELNTGGGSSGSPALDLSGCVVGVLTQGHSFQARIMPSNQLHDLIGGTVPLGERADCGGDRREAARPSRGRGTDDGDGRTGTATPANDGLGQQQNAELDTLLDVAASYIVYHKGRFADRLNNAIPRQYVDTGLFFFPEQHRRKSSRIETGDRAAVAKRYGEIIEDVFTRIPNTREYLDIASAITAARRSPR
jgi:hypothetical protein